MKHPRIVLWLSIFLFIGLPIALPGQTDCNAGAGPLRHDPPQGIAVPELIKTFAAKESTFEAARQKFAFTEDVTVQTLFANGNQVAVDGEYRQVMEVSYDDSGRRQEHLTFAPQSTLRRISLTPADLQDFRDYMPFALTAADLPHYDVTYNGRQRVDELDTYVFEVAPKMMEQGRRYFKGRLWVETRDAVVVKSCGKSVPERVTVSKKGAGTENVQPLFVTYREQFEGGYWFPVYTRSDDFLQFRREMVRIRETIKYQNYKRLGSSKSLNIEDAAEPEGTNQ